MGRPILRALSRRLRPNGATDRHVELPVWAKKNSRRGNTSTEPLTNKDVPDFRQRPRLEAPPR